MLSIYEVHLHLVLCHCSLLFTLNRDDNLFLTLTESALVASEQFNHTSVGEQM